MSAFAAAVDAIFADPNMAADAIWREDRVGPPVTVRVIRKSPDQIAEYAEARMILPSTMVDVRVSDLPEPEAGDMITIQGEDFIIQGQPRRDRERLVWTIGLVAP